jgi:NAD+ diphosphatase
LSLRSKVLTSSKSYIKADKIANQFFGVAGGRKEEYFLCRAFRDIIVFIYLKREGNMRYPEAVNLPFNSTIIKDDFRPFRPGEEAAGGSGFWIIVRGSAFVVRKDGESLSLCEGALPDWAVAGEGPLAIGRWQGKPLGAVRIGDNAVIPRPYVAEQFLAAEERLDDRLLTLGGLARQILHWERTSRHCSLCGGNSGRIPGSWGKKCLECGYENYPHIHPCIIVLVRRGEEFLLARKPEWSEGRYSLVAGFLEFGESLEECVQREVREETGIAVKNAQYVGSQNWPFPGQLMAGFVADHAGGEIVVDRAELEDARWFSRNNMPPDLPGRRSIARWIIDRFMLGTY